VPADALPKGVRIMVDMGERMREVVYATPLRGILNTVAGLPLDYPLLYFLGGYCDGLFRKIEVRGFRGNCTTHVKPSALLRFVGGNPRHSFMRIQDYGYILYATSPTLEFRLDDEILLARAIEAVIAHRDRQAPRAPC